MHSVMVLVPLLVARAAAPGPVMTPLVVLPERFEARAGEPLAFTLQDSAGNTLAWGDHRTTWTFVRVAGTQENRNAFAQPAQVQNAGAPVPIDLSIPGVTMIGVEFDPWTIEVTREQLDTMLQSLVSDAERDAALKDAPADRKLRARVTASAKSLVRVLTPEGDDAPVDAPQTVGSKSGQFNEIRVLLDPLHSLVGGDITVRFHADYDKSPRTRAFASNLDTGKAQEIESDASGIALFHLDEPGRWRVTFATARAAPPGDTADIIVHTASLTFAATRTEVKK